MLTIVCIQWMQRADSRPRAADSRPYGFYRKFSGNQSHKHFQFWTKYSMPEYRVVATITNITMLLKIAIPGRAIMMHRPTMVLAVLT